MNKFSHRGFLAFSFLLLMLCFSLVLAMSSMMGRADHKNSSISHYDAMLLRGQGALDEMTRELLASGKNYDSLAKIIESRKYSLYKINGFELVQNHSYETSNASKVDLLLIEKIGNRLNYYPCDLLRQGEGFRLILRGIIPS